MVAPARWSRVESGSTSSFSRAANAPTVRSASSLAQLNRQSITCCTRRRTGLNRRHVSGLKPGLGGSGAVHRLLIVINKLQYAL